MSISRARPDRRLFRIRRDRIGVCGGDSGGEHHATSQVRLAAVLSALFLLLVPASAFGQAPRRRPTPEPTAARHWPLPKRLRAARPERGRRRAGRSGGSATRRTSWSRARCSPRTSRATSTRARSARRIEQEIRLVGDPAPRGGAARTPTTRSARPPRSRSARPATGVRSRRSSPRSPTASARFRRPRSSRSASSARARSSTTLRDVLNDTTRTARERGLAAIALGYSGGDLARDRPLRPARRDQRRRGPGPRRRASKRDRVLGAALWAGADKKDGTAPNRSPLAASLLQRALSAPQLKDRMILGIGSAALSKTRDPRLAAVHPARPRGSAGRRPRRLRHRGRHGSSRPRTAGASRP